MYNGKDLQKKSARTDGQPGKGVFTHMYKINFNEPKKVHFTGIGGISMSGLAEILLSEGFSVRGSDQTLSAITRHLEDRGAVIFQGHRRENVAPDTDVLVYTAAVGPDNPELAAAAQLSIPTLTRAQLLGQMMKNYSPAIGIAGTHGKTTTTAMISQIFLEADADPTILVGGIMPAIDGNIRIGNSKNFITEACEYTNSFLSFSPTTGVILNVRADHLDFFKDIDDIYNSFREYARLIPDDGLLVVNKDIERLSFITDGLGCKITTFSVDDETADFTAKNITFDELARASFDIIAWGKHAGSVSLKLPGKHNVSNALAAAAAAAGTGMSFSDITAGLSECGGAKRRFEHKGDLGGVTVIDDYAHHPDEIRATLKTAKQFRSGKIWCVFQPHTYSRTAALLDEFADALAGADEVILADIYAAREKNTIGITSEDLQKKLVEKGTSARYFPSFEEIENFLLKNLINGDMLITMGAGDIVNVGDHLLKK